MESFIESARKFFEPLSAAQKFLFGLLTVIVVGAITALFIWASRPDYTLLFGSLSSESANQIVEELKTQGISYRLENDGSTILVPENQVYELRLQFASKGSANTDYQGYELFDGNTLGMTDFMQRVNMKRALEGELARTINSMAPVDFSRVHLVMAERSPFEESNVEPSASVIVNMKPNQNLTPSQIEGIASLVAGSVEKLTPQRVTILDEQGNQISNNELLGSEFAASNAQMKHRQSTEKYLTHKAQTMLDRVLGSGNSIVRVSTEHDFEQLERESNLIDPDSRIIISEEQRTERLSDNQGQPIEYDQYTPPALRGETVTTSQNTQEATVKIRNYEVNSTRQQYKKPVGEISKISASLLLNYKREILEGAQGQDSVTYDRYSQQELNEIRDIVAASIGLNITRGDQLTVTQIRFDNTIEDVLQEQQVLYEEQLEYNQYLRWGLILLAVIASVALLYAILRRLFPNTVPPVFMQPQVEGKEEEEQKALPKDQRKELPEGEEYDEDEAIEVDLENQADMYRRKLSPAAQRRLKMKSKMFEEIKNFSEFKSDEAASLLRSMMVKNEEGNQ